MLHTMDTQKLRNKTELYLDPINSTTRNYDSIKCKDGWIYNRTMFPNTVVMEVLIEYLKNFNKKTKIEQDDNSFFYANVV